MHRDISIKALLIIGFLVSGLIPLMATAILGLSTARGELVAQSFRHLESVRDLKKAEIERFFDERLRQVSLIAEDPYVATALQDFKKVVSEQGGESSAGLVGHTSGTFDAPLAYRRVHDNHYRFFAQFAKQYSFYDVFLMDSQTGFTYFTVKKEEDFGIPIGAVDSSLRDVWSNAAKGSAALSDTRHYAPSGNIPAQFIAAPIHSRSGIEGVVAVQLSIDSIDRIMGERSGMGRTGETYLVGQDLKMRSDSARDPDNHSVNASFRGTVKHNGVDTRASRAALEGKTGSGQIIDFRGRPVLSAFAPVTVGPVRWAIIAEIEEAEIDDTIAAALNVQLTVIIAVSALLLVVLALGISTFIDSAVRQVVRDLGTLIDKVLSGQVEARLNPEDIPLDFREVASKTNELSTAFMAQAAQNRRLEDVLQYNQRMESIGTLAGGIAHDFNNILTYMYTYAELVRVDLTPGTKAHSHMAEIAAGIERATDLVSQIMLFGRQIKRDKRPVRVDLIVKEALKLLRATLPRSIRVEKRISGEDIHLLADPTHLHQIVMNLCTNAFHAMQSTGGVMTIELNHTVLVDNERPGLPPGPYCELKVMDTGVGIDPEIKPRVFEPFFTTKPPGQGSGMGLSVVHGIVASYEGLIEIDSELGRGTEVTVLLPIQQAPAWGTPTTTQIEIVHGQGRVLLVDDEPDICESVGQLLSTLGYTVATRTNPREALELLSQDPAGFDLLITDLSMPDIDGASLTRAALSLRPDLPVVMTTGYTEAMTDDKARQLGARALLLKPYDKHRLSEVVAAAISSQIAQIVPDAAK